jgi:hypothetical protein
VSPTDHEHTFVWDGHELLPCACGANVLAIEAALHVPAADARRAAGDAYYTGCEMRQELEMVELWLSNAPLQVLQELESMHPGAYLIRNDAPRPETVVFELRDSLDADRLRAEGIRIVRIGPTQEGYLHVAVMGDVPTAQARLDAILGTDVARVEYAEPVRQLSYQGPLTQRHDVEDAQSSEKGTRRQSAPSNAYWTASPRLLTSRQL